MPYYGRLPREGIQPIVSQLNLADLSQAGEPNKSGDIDGPRRIETYVRSVEVWRCARGANESVEIGALK